MPHMAPRGNASATLAAKSQENMCRLGWRSLALRALPSGSGLGDFRSALQPAAGSNPTARSHCKPHLPTLPPECPDWALGGHPRLGGGQNIHRAGEQGCNQRAWGQAGRQRPRSRWRATLWVRRGTVALPRAQAPGPLKSFGGPAPLHKPPRPGIEPGSSA